MRLNKACITLIHTGFPSGVFCCFTTEKQHGRPLRLPGNAYLIVLKVGVTCTYVNENEEQPTGFATRKIFKEQYLRKTITQLKRHFCA